MRTKITSVYDLSKQEYAAQVDLAARTAAPIFRLFGWTWAPIARVPDEVDNQERFRRQDLPAPES